MFVVGQVHHFVLYDNQARGFVRPYCMVFITTDVRYSRRDMSYVNPDLSLLKVWVKAAPLED